MELSKHFLGIINFIFLLLSLPILGTGIWLATKHSTDCLEFLQAPLIVLGVFIFLLSLGGCLGAYRRLTCLLAFYLVAMALLILVLFAFAVFALVVTRGGGGQPVPGAAYHDYRIRDFSVWFQKWMGRPRNWRHVKSCLVDAHVCNELSAYRLATEFSNATLSPLQSGCCKPPSSCNFLFLNATYWTRPLTESADPDCKAYSYKQHELCFDCDSCRAGAIEQVKKHWRKVAAVNITVVVLLVVLFSLACHMLFCRRGGPAQLIEPKYKRYQKGIY